MGKQVKSPKCNSTNIQVMGNDRKDWTLVKKTFTMLIATMLILLIGACGEGSKSSSDALIFDAPQFSRLSYDELVSKMGCEPTYVEKWVHHVDEATSFPLITYGFDTKELREQNLYVEFVSARKADEVVRVNVWSTKAFFGTGSDIKYNGSSDAANMFAMFGIIPETKYSSGTNYRTSNSMNHNYAMRYLRVSSEIDDFWIPIMDADSKTIELVTVTYNNYYFGGYSPLP